MKFELEPYHLNLSDEDLLDDLKKVALKLGKEKISEREYDANGQYSKGTLKRRYGGLE